ncbi:hypothetical protein JA13_168 [Dickeya phage vB_DsoM_JA13]|uniref:Uncharacterized protein n=1 Tax=Dickeya phage vB_DsoM_JA13 TaxID=2283030 RepID=A0A384ZWG1_9CAUD|nr:hypothetical protein JA13_168 [Dickeya phage vB_DsoM_JA13]
MPAISLDDFGAEHTAKKKKSGIKIKAKSTAKKAKVVSAVKTKKKKKTGKSERLEDLKVALDPEVLYSEAAAAGKKANEKKAKKEKKKKKLPALLNTAEMEDQAQVLIEAIPDIVRQENEQIDEYIRMFDQLKVIVRKAEDRYLDTGQGRDLYPLMQVYNQMRELIADLRALRDVGQLGEVISSEVVTPFAQLGGNSMVKMAQEINAWIKSNCDDLSLIENSKEAIDGILRRAAKDFQISYEAALNKTVEVFG